MTGGQIAGALMVAAVFVGMTVGMWRSLGFRDAVLAWLVIFGLTAWTLGAAWLLRPT